MHLLWLLGAIVGHKEPYSTTTCTPMTRLHDCGKFLVCAAPVGNSSAAPICRACVTDKDCIDVAEEMECVADEVPRPAWRIVARPTDPAGSRGECKHKLLIPMDVRDLIGFILVFVACALAAGGGIGGGGMLVPLLLVVFGFDAHDATPLSNVAILGGAVASCIVNVQKQHPLREKPLIAYEVALMMEPMTMLGALVGTLLNKICPGWLITLLLVLLLGLTANRTWTKGMKGWQKEVHHAQVRQSRKLAKNGSRVCVDGIMEGLLHSEASSPASIDGLLPLRSRTLEEQESAQAAAQAVLEGDKGSDELQDLLVSERRTLHYGKDVLALVTLLLASSTLSMLRGRSFALSPLGVHCGSSAYWSLNSAQLVLVFVVSAAIRQMLMKRHMWKVQHGYPFLPDDVKWDHKTTARYPALCVGAGLCAGMFGIGGGIVKGPLMLEMGLLPVVSSATSSFMILFTSGTAAINYAILGSLDVYYAPLLFLVGLGSTLLGQWGLSSLIKRFNKQSIIVLAISVVVAMSAVAMGVVGVLTTKNEIAHGQSQGFHNLCGEMVDDD